MRPAISVAIGLLVLSPALLAAPVPVEYAEGVTHGFLELRDTSGNLLAHGEQLTTGKDHEFDKRMVFRFKDGSTLAEHVTFTQEREFRVTTYSLKTSGPAFEHDTEVSMNPPAGTYRFVTKEKGSDKERVEEGKLDMPADVYNGMLMTIVKDLPRGVGETVHYVAFTPKARLIEVELIPTGDDGIKVGDLDMTAAHYVLRPRLGPWLKMFASLTGRSPRDGNAWIVKDAVPAFVAFEGELTTPGPVWRIETVSPRRSR